MKEDCVLVVRVDVVEKQSGNGPLNCMMTNMVYAPPKCARVLRRRGTMARLRDLTVYNEPLGHLSPFGNPGRGRGRPQKSWRTRQLLPECDEDWGEGMVLEIEPLDCWERQWEDMTNRSTRLELMSIETG